MLSSGIIETLLELEQEPHRFDDEKVETLLRDKNAYIFQLIDTHQYDKHINSCEKCKLIKLDRIPKRNGKITGSGNIKYI